MAGLLGRSLTKDTDLDAREVLQLLDFAAALRSEKRLGRERHRLEGRNIALIFEKTSTRTRSAFEVAASDQGAHPTYMGPDETQLGHKESMKDTARVLGRMFDGIEFRGFSQESMDTLATNAGVPSWNGLTDVWHPTQALADVLTMRDHSGKPLSEVTVAYVGDARNNTATSLLVTGATLGMGVRIGAPSDRWPALDVRDTADRLAETSGARIAVLADAAEAVLGADFVYTDVWVSMGEPVSSWGERIDLLLPYQVNATLMRKTENPDAKFLHCLPALHNLETEIGRRLHDQYGLSELEVTDEVFESRASVVFDQAENRLHTIKALMVATVAGLTS